MGSPVSLNGPSFVYKSCCRVCGDERRRHVGSVAAITRCSGKPCAPKGSSFVYMSCVRVCEDERRSHVGSVVAIMRRGGNSWIPKRILLCICVCVIHPSCALSSNGRGSVCACPLIFWARASFTKRRSCKPARIPGGGVFAHPLAF